MSNQLFVYGTLGPGQPNEYILKEIGGTFKKASVKGKLFNKGWASEMGYPGIKLNEKIETIEGHVFYADFTEEDWQSLDDFEGEAYKRVTTTVTLTDTGDEIEVFVYELR